ncbi:hypothetical protein HMN09_01103400 [Mycena chlorophos]|uniref:Uncharacterized protein n=1 Tax=Mycena chlorophos TaxID=658473 RepID=A0A8H6W1X3_MYCCL|nr:hypothetical protein HMN09_01103400 [Mycena chlorophos]
MQPAYCRLSLDDRWSTPRFRQQPLLKTQAGLPMALVGLGAAPHGDLRMIRHSFRKLRDDVLKTDTADIEVLETSFGSRFGHDPARTTKTRCSDASAYTRIRPTGYASTCIRTQPLLVNPNPSHESLLHPPP